MAVLACTETVEKQRKKVEQEQEKKKKKSTQQKKKKTTDAPLQTKKKKKKKAPTETTSTSTTTRVNNKNTTPISTQKKKKAPLETQKKKAPTDDTTSTATTRVLNNSNTTPISKKKKKTVGTAPSVVTPPPPRTPPAPVGEGITDVDVNKLVELLATALVRNKEAILKDGGAFSVFASEMSHVRPDQGEQYVGAGLGSRKLDNFVEWASDDYLYEDIVNFHVKLLEFQQKVGTLEGVTSAGTRRRLCKNLFKLFKEMHNANFIRKFTKGKNKAKLQALYETKCGLV